MGYDLHIIRTKTWADASSAPITKSDVDALIDADPELAWSKSDYVDMSDDAGGVTRYWMIACVVNLAFGGIATRFCVQVRTMRS
jgi:hypothetical protein